MTRFFAFLIAIATATPAAAADFEMAVPSGIDVEMKGLSVDRDYMVATIAVSSPIVDLLSAKFDCKAKKKEGFTWSLSGNVGNIAKGSSRDARLVSLSPMDEYSTGSPVVALRCYAKEIKYGYIDLFP
ncbi:hypothetical protein CSC94_12740 [Zhengella mangrovi]|uniref:Uncharacterized protein n=1 Tax=Zhengella mangrovi TaxID=1982044 RepID=A0A2G1QM70_9HYPH|nr:hypothetical protein [Zhengella mangrovi]PHP66550.1 hypothetical protein CSC94_12740 [Zhengella mangrovi]